MISDKFLAKVSERAASEHTFEEKNIQVLIIEKREATVIAFRGTEFKPVGEGLKDIFTNLKAKPKNTLECGKVHSGIYEAAKAASGTIAKRIPKGTVLNLTGHSMGGAIALLAAPILKELGYFVRVTTFGSPKVVCNSEDTLNKFSNIYVMQYIHKGDIVTKKFFNWPWNYTHIKTKIIGSATGYSWKDHDIDKYIELV